MSAAEHEPLDRRRFGLRGCEGNRFIPVDSRATTGHIH